MEAFFTTGRITYPLIQISTSDMQAIFDDEFRGGVRGIPQYFDCHERLWPQPESNAYTVNFVARKSVA
jgi:hypothetical protein